MKKPILLPMAISLSLALTACASDSNTVNKAPQTSKTVMTQTNSECNNFSDKALCERAYSGDTDAMLALYGLYLKGNGVQKSEKEAVKWLKKSAKAGNARAQGILANHYFLGLNGVFRSESEAMKWTKKAAAGGDQGSQTLLKNMEIMNNL